MADECEHARSCPAEAPPENELDDPSILPETGAGPVVAEPPVVTSLLTPCDISFLQQNFRPLINFSKLAADAAAADAAALASFAAAGAAVAGYDAAAAGAAAVAAAAAAGNDAAAAAFSIVNQVATKAHDAAAAEGHVPTETQQRDHYGFIESDEVSSNRTEDITIDINPLSVSFQIMGYIESQIKTQLLDRFSLVFDTLYKGLSVCVPDLGANTIKGFVGINKCGFLSKYTTVIYYAGKIPYNYREAIVTLIEQCNTEIKSLIKRWSTAGVTYNCKVEKSPVQYDTQKIILSITLATGNVIQIPILNVVGFPVFEDVNPLLRLLGYVDPPSLPCFADSPASQCLSLLDIIVRVRLCANQGAITALSEPSKEEVTLILHCFQGFIPGGVLPPPDANVSAIAVNINAITKAIRTTLYSQTNIKPFSLFCNIFYNFINVSLGFRSLAKIIYSDFFGTSNNYGKVIRACQVVNRLPTMSDRVKFFLTGSNAARVYLALNEIIKLGGTITPENVAFILSKTFGNLSDNDFMIYLKNNDSEPYRVFIRMILGGSFYFFKNLFDDTTTRQFTLEMIQSVGIVGFMDHLFAQRFDASAVFLQQCYIKDPTSFLAHILPSMEAYFGNLDKQINVAHLDGVFKYYTLKKFYQEVFRIFDLTERLGTQAGSVYTFLIDHATSIDCIATVWTLVLNVLYTLFVPENCLARIAVGKFDNDPKNLKLYMEILNDHLSEVGRNSMETEDSEFIKDIMELLRYQQSIITSCNGGINRGLDEKILNQFKQTCGEWVLKMVSMVVRVPGTGVSKYKGLFMLSVSDASTVGSRFSTRLEKALCLAYYPTQQGNICSAASNGPEIFLDSLKTIITTSPFPMDISKSTDPSHEVALHGLLNHMGTLMDTCFRPTGSIPITIQPERNTTQLSTYLNFMWNHLTKTAIKLKILFKENLQDTKRVTGIKYIALVLGGYFQVRLLVDDVSDQCRLPKELNSFKTSQEMMACKRGLLPLLKEQPLLALIKAIMHLDNQNGTYYTDPIPKILKILGFLFSIKVKSSSPHSPYQLLRLEDSILIFPFPKDDTRELQILNPNSGMFIEFLRALDVDVTNRAIMKCICREGGKNEVLRIDTEMRDQAMGNPLLQQLYTAVGGSNNSKSNSGRKSVSSSNKNKYKYIHTKSLKKNNHTRRNKNNRKKNSKTKTKFNTKSSPKHRKVIPSSRSGSQSNRKKSKPKKSQKNVTFKRRRPRK
jgi:hypothetical protein